MTEGADGTRDVQRTPADHSPSEQLGQRIADADPRESSQDLDDAEVTAFARSVRRTAALYRQHGGREALWRGSPVRSNSFL